jgi:hypothetical protein
MIGEITKIAWDGDKTIVLKRAINQFDFPFSTRQDFDMANALVGEIIRNYKIEMTRAQGN